MVGGQSASTAARQCHLRGRRRKASIFEKAVSRTGRSARWTAGYTQGSIASRRRTGRVQRILERRRAIPPDAACAKLCDTNGDLYSAKPVR
jgi:hypothetical protein